RELENIIERGVALESSNIILPESLTLSIHRRAERDVRNEAAADPAEDVYRIGLDKFIADQEMILIKNALEKAGNSKIRAAELLKISFRSLRYKVKKYGL
ncbi:MAG: helix-turn-helix domain-containing protein, partial [Desulfurivibrionaceae bacterium]|nr:helix-turn-helix domain-containing protein [Desulfurivibrionaceae bacterium]